VAEHLARFPAGEDWGPPDRPVIQIAGALLFHLRRTTLKETLQRCRVTPSERSLVLSFLGTAYQTWRRNNPRDRPLTMTLAVAAVRAMRWLPRPLLQDADLRPAGTLDHPVPVFDYDEVDRFLDLEFRGCRVRDRSFARNGSRRLEEVRLTGFADTERSVFFECV
jgi:hypothetical protein